MAVLSVTEVPKLKELAEEFGYHIHLHDACGGQAFTLEAEGNASDEIYNALEMFFDQHNMEIKYYDEKRRNFSAR